jgi:saccharopine dehydrogenase (NAD+, L-lysine-forming)
MIEGIPSGGAERVAGELVPRPLASDQREIEFPHRRRWAMTIPWGDLSTAYRSTGIPNIRVYTSISPRRLARLRMLAPLRPVLGMRPFKRSLQWLVRRRVTGPSPEIRDTAKTYFWGSVRDDRGETRTATLTAPEGYRLTAMTAVECLARVLAGEVRPGAWTPAQAFGADFIKTFAEVEASW